MLAKLIARAEEDTAFRSRLAANSGTALKDAFDVDVADDFNSVDHEDDARTTHLVLNASAEVTD